MTRFYHTVGRRMPDTGIQGLAVQYTLFWRLINGKWRAGSRCRSSREEQRVSW